MDYRNFGRLGIHKDHLYFSGGKIMILFDGHLTHLVYTLDEFEYHYGCLEKNYIIYD